MGGRQVHRLGSGEPLRGGLSTAPDFPVHPRCITLKELSAMKRTINYLIWVGVLGLSITGCEHELDITPKGILTASQLQEPEQLDGFVTAAYAFMPMSHAFETYNPFIASLRSDDAYKGGGGLNDQTPWYQMEVFSLTNASVGNNDGSWYRGYQGVSRTNTAIRAIEAVTV